MGGDGYETPGTHDTAIEEHEVPAFCPFYCDRECQKESLFFDQIIAAAMGLTCIIYACWNISKHLKYFNNPYFQSKIIVILCMAPFYCVSSLISIFYNPLSPYVTVVRDTYEAFLLFTFLYLILSYIAYNDETQLIDFPKLYRIMVNQPPEHGDLYFNVHHLWPFNYCTTPYRLSTEAKAKYFTYRCKKWVLQCFILKPLTAIITLILYPVSGYIPYYDSIMSFIYQVIFWSVSYSLYYLLLFYHALKGPLTPYNPLFKFLVVKITLFFTFWQALTLMIIEEQLLECFQQKDNPDFNGHLIMTDIENTLILFEMLLMSLAASRAFTFHDFKASGVSKTTFKEAINSLWTEFLQDLRLITPVRPGPPQAEFKTTPIELQKIDPERESQFHEVEFKGGNLNKHLIINNY